MENKEINIDFRARIQEALAARKLRCQEWVDKIKEWILTDVEKGHIMRTYSFSYLSYISDVDFIAQSLSPYKDFFKIAQREKSVVFVMNEHITASPFDEWTTELLEAYQQVVNVHVHQITDQIVSNIRNGILKFTVDLTSLYYKSFIETVCNYFAKGTKPGFVKMSTIERDMFLEFDIEKF